MTSIANQLLPALDFARENGTDGLQRAQTTVDSLLQAMDAAVQLEPFSSSPHRFLAASTCLLFLSMGLLLGSARPHLRWTILQVASVAVAIVFVTGGFDVLLPHTTDTNILVEVAPSARETRSVLLSAHLDSKTEPFDHVTRSILLLGLVVLLPVTAVLQHRIRRNRQRWLATLPAVLLALLLCFQGSAGLWLPQRSHGIRDNAAACALLAELCSRALHRPLEHTRLQFAWWSGEEIAAQGSQAWVQQHAGALPDIAINLELIGAGDQLAIAALEWTERGFRRPDATLVEWFDRRNGAPLRRVAAPVLTDAGAFLAAGVRAATLLNLPTSQRWPRGIHSPEDALDSLQPQGLARTRDTLLAFLRHLDSDPTTSRNMPAETRRHAARHAPRHQPTLLQSTP